MRRRCCCNVEEMINDCTDFSALWSTLTECHINISGVNDVGCTNCAANLGGDWILDSTTGSSMVANCDLFKDGVAFIQDPGGDPGPEGSCFVDFDFVPGENRYRVWPLCESGGVTLNLSAVVGTSACKEIAQKTLTFPFTAADLMTGTMLNTGAGASSACHITGDVPYEFFA